MLIEKKLGWQSHSIPIILLFCLLTGLVIFLFWSARLGLDLTDESYFLLGYNYPERVNTLERGFHQLYSGLCFFFDHTAYHDRIARIVLTLASSLIFAWGLNTNLSHYLGKAFSKQNKVLLTLTICFGAFLSYSRGTQTISYNSLSLIFSLLFLGSTLLFMRSKSTLRILYLVLMGIGLFSLARIKFSIPPLITIVVLPLILSSIGFKRLIGLVTPIVSISFIAIAYVHFGSFESIFDWIQSVVHSAQHPNAAHGSDVLKKVYQKDFTRMIDDVFVKYWWYFTIPFIAHGYNRLNPLKHKVNVILVGISILSVLVLIDNMYLGGTPNRESLVTPYYLLLVFVLIHLILSRLTNQRGEVPNREKPFVYLLFTLAVIPFIISIGTNNGIFSHITISLVFWFVLVAVIVLVSEKSDHRNVILSVIAIFLAALTSGQVYSAVHDFPYRLNHDLEKQNYSLKTINPKEDVFVDEETFNTISDLQKILSTKTKFSFGDPVYTFRHQTGFTYALGGVPPTVYWYYEKDVESICNQLKRTDLHELESMIYIIPKSLKSTFEKVIECDLPYKIEPLETVGAIPYGLMGRKDSIYIICPQSRLKNNHGT